MESTARIHGRISEMWRREKEWNEAWKTGRFSLLWTVEMYARVPRTVLTALQGHTAVCDAPA